VVSDGIQAWRERKKCQRRKSNHVVESFHFTDLDKVEFVGEAIAILKRVVGSDEPDVGGVPKGNSLPDDPEGEE